MTASLHLQLKERLTQNASEVLQELQQIFAHSGDKLNEVFKQKARLEKYRKDQRGGAWSNEDLNREFNQIHDAIVGLIDLITPEEAAAYELENAIFKRILVVCKSAGREEYMRRLFPETYFKGVEYDVSENPRPAASVNRFDLVVFDNHPHGEPDDPHTLLKYYLEETKPFLLYFGRQLNLLWQYPEKAYFANSIFSLHGRIDEMIKFLKYYS